MENIPALVCFGAHAVNMAQSCHIMLALGFQLSSVHDAVDPTVHLEWALLAFLPKEEDVFSLSTTKKEDFITHSPT